ncbi:MAG: hypothetical protein GF346_00070 [Candidatus Eisenbacteria bacterium]|nr:hypothetical protein [Candidatus Latescibacterota bacterium]MBD3300827.1 hypothetical protein [Candidatus Eisenbacteria bacterium]
MRVRRRYGIWIAMLGILAAAAPGSTAGPFEAGIGVGYAAPRANRLADLYDPGPTFHLLVARRFDRPAVSLGFEIGYIRRSADLSSPFFVGSPRATLTWIPLELTVRAPLRPEAALTPIVGVGGTLLWARERFEYDLLDEPNTLQPDDRVDPGFLLLAGLERTIAPRFRIEAYLSVVPTEPHVATSEWVRPAEDEELDAGSFGVRLHWRFP